MIGVEDKVRAISMGRRQQHVSAHRLRNALARLLLHVVLIAAAAALMLPVSWLVISSIKTDVEFISYPPRFLPRHAQWANYVDVVVKYGFLRYAGRTVYLATMFTITNVLSCSFAGYGFARCQAPGRNLLFIVLLSTVMVPGIVTIIPQFVLYSRMRIVGTYWPWLLWGLGGSAYQIFVFRQFFASFPVELEDAAAVDGCNPLRTFWQIFVPNAKPVMTATALFAFQWVWGDFFNQTLLLSENNATLAMKLASAFVDPRGNALVTVTLAAVVIYILPLVAAYFVGQKQIVQGIVTTGIK